MNYRPLQVLTVLVMAALPAGCGPAETADKNEEVGPSALTAPADYVHAGYQAGENAKATMGLLAINRAISSYQMQHGAHPPSLEQLEKEDLIAEIPPAPRGQKYHYDPETGKVTLVAK